MLRMRKGHVVTMASMASFTSIPGLVEYCVSKIGALYLNDGLRAECLSRYPGGEGIRTTSVHPSWHATAILKGSEEKLKKLGIVPDPATNVTDLVVEQVLKARSGRLHVPKGQEKWAGIGHWPLWVKDILFGNVLAQKKGFRSGDGGTDPNPA